MKTPQFTLHRVKALDYPQVAELLRSANLPLDGVQENFKTFLEARDSHGRLVGVAGLEVYGKSALLRSVAVAESRRGEGIGSQLVTRAVEEARGLGVARLYLLTDTAEKYFAHFGFKQIGRDTVDASLQQSAEFKGACKETAVAMYCPL